MTAIPENLKTGDIVQIFQWRNKSGNFFQETVNEEGVWKEDGTFYVGYTYPYGEVEGTMQYVHHYAEWNFEKSRWDDGLY